MLYALVNVADKDLLVKTLVKSVGHGLLVNLLMLSHGHRSALMSLGG